jgi:hypothetical protein
VTNPFANPFADTAVIEHGDPFPNETIESPTTEVKPMTNDSEAVTVTLKAGTGFDAPWIVVRGSSAEDVKSKLDSVGQTELMNAVATAGRNFVQVNGGKAASAPAQSAPAAAKVDPWNAGPPAAAAAPAAAPTGFPVKTCQHGNRVRRTGENARGTWVAHFCPTPKGAPDQCPAIWGDK